jgi:hypothetical protein
MIMLLQTYRSGAYHMIVCSDGGSHRARAGTRLLLLCNQHTVTVSVDNCVCITVVNCYCDTGIMM